MRENGVYSAPGPLISIIPSWNPTTVPVVTTAAPRSTAVLPEPTVSSSPVKKPGKHTPVPSSLQRGSITSLTEIIRVLSPGFVIVNETSVISGSSFIRDISSSLLISRQVPWIAVFAANRIS